MTRDATSEWVRLYQALKKALRRIETSTADTLQPQFDAPRPSLAAANAFLSHSLLSGALTPSFVELVAHSSEHSLLSLLALTRGALQRAIALGSARGDPALSHWPAGALNAVANVINLLVQYFILLAVTFKARPDAAAHLAAIAFVGSSEYCDTCDSVAALLPGPLKPQALTAIKTVLALCSTNLTFASAMQTRLCASNLLPALCSDLIATVAGGGELTVQDDEDVKAFLDFLMVVLTGEEPGRNPLDSQISGACMPLRTHIAHMPGLYGFVMACMHLPHDTHVSNLRLASHAGSVLLKASWTWLHDASALLSPPLISGDNSDNARGCGSEGAASLPPFFPSVADVAGTLQFVMAHPDCTKPASQPALLVSVLCSMVEVFTLMWARLTDGDRRRAFMPIATFVRKAVAAALILSPHSSSSSSSSSSSGSCEDSAEPAATATECVQACAARRPTSLVVDVGNSTGGPSRGTEAATSASVLQAHSPQSSSLPQAAITADIADGRHGARRARGSDNCWMSTGLFEQALQLLLLVLDEASSRHDGVLDSTSTLPAWHRSHCLWVLRSGLLPACDEYLRTVVFAQQNEQALNAAAAERAAAAAATADAGDPQIATAAAAATTSAEAGHITETIRSSNSPATLCLCVALLTAHRLPDDHEAQAALLRMATTVRKVIIRHSPWPQLFIAGPGLSNCLHIIKLVLWRLGDLSLLEPEAGERWPYAACVMLVVFALQLLPAIVRLAKACIRADPGRCHDERLHKILRQVALGDALSSCQLSLSAGVPSLMQSMLVACAANADTVSSAASSDAAAAAAVAAAVPAATTTATIEAEAPAAEAATAAARARIVSTASAVEALLVTYDIEGLPHERRAMLEGVADRLQQLLGRTTGTRQLADVQDFHNVGFSWDDVALSSSVNAETFDDGVLFLGCWWRGCTNLAGRSEAELQLRRCGGCRVARYCSEVCQRRAWVAGHRAACSMDCSNSAAES